MTNTRFLSEGFDTQHASEWVATCATSAGWSDGEASRLATCITESVRTVSERAYRLNDAGPVFVKLDLDDQLATLELHHEGAVGDQPCTCAAAQAASEMVSTNWKDAQLRTHHLKIERA